jgi:protein-tyrosine kinase
MKSAGPSTIEQALLKSDVSHHVGRRELTQTIVERAGLNDGKLFSGSLLRYAVGPEESSSVARLHRPESIQPISSATLDQHRIIAGHKGHPAAEQFDILRTRILREMSVRGWRTLGVTSPMPRCGKTTVAINLCISIAKGIQRDVVLVDLDLRNPRVASYLGINSSPDLSNFLDGEVSFQATLVNPGIPRLLILPNHKTYLESSEALTTPEAVSLAQNLRSVEGIEMVVFDLPPLLPTDDTLAFLPQVDCLLVVLADGKSTKRELEETRQLLEQANVLGFVLNQVE